MVSIQKSDRSSSPPRRDGDADPARLLSRSCGLVSRAGSAAHHAHRQKQAHMHTSCEPILGGAAPRAAARVSQKATCATAKRVQVYSMPRNVCSMPRNVALPLAHIAWYAAVQGVMSCERVTARKREREREIERK